jgi:hypothetical protein
MSTPVTTRSADAVLLATDAAPLALEGADDAALLATDAALLALEGATDAALLSHEGANDAVLLATDAALLALEGATDAALLSREGANDAVLLALDGATDAVPLALDGATDAVPPALDGATDAVPLVLDGIGDAASIALDNAASVIASLEDADSVATSTITGTVQPYTTTTRATSGSVNASSTTAVDAVPLTLSHSTAMLSITGVTLEGTANAIPLAPCRVASAIACSANTADADKIATLAITDRADAAPDTGTIRIKGQQW